MTKSLSLPKANYKITKKKATNDNLRFVDVGDSYMGETEPTILVGECFFFNGGSVRDYLRTSLVKDFELLNGNKVLIHTQNSQYLLEEI